MFGNVPKIGYICTRILPRAVSIGLRQSTMIWKRIIMPIVIGLLLGLVYVAVPQVFAVLLLLSIVVWTISFVKWVVK